MKDSKTTNPELIQLIDLLKREGREKQAGIWLDLAEYLSKARSQRIAVNLSKINRNTKRAETVVVPGKILGSGAINHALTVASFSASEKAKVKLAAAKVKYISIPELVKKNPEGSNVKIIR
jgi:large subunit ribosomal protein L18e